MYIPMHILFSEKELNELMDELFEAYGGADLLEDGEPESPTEPIPSTSGKGKPIGDKEKETKSEGKESTKKSAPKKESIGKEEPKVAEKGNDGTVKESERREQPKRRYI